MSDFMETMEHLSNDNPKKAIWMCMDCARMNRCWNPLLQCAEWSDRIPSDCVMKAEYLIEHWNMGRQLMSGIDEKTD